MMTDPISILLTYLFIGAVVWMLLLDVVLAESRRSTGAPFALLTLALILAWPFILFRLLRNAMRP